MINVVGLGYIGLPTALILASRNKDVVGTDINQSVIDLLDSGKVPFEEKGINELYKAAICNGIVFRSKLIVADFYIISVPTPFDKNTKRLNPDFVIRAMNDVLDVCPKGSVIVIESTISPGTFDKYIRPLVEKRKMTVGSDVHLCHAPERIIPGNMLFELENNSRTIGVDDYEIGSKVRDIYKTFCKGTIEITDIKTAEMTKVVENTYRDVNIAFANELAKICREDGMDVYEIIRIANMHPRVKILQPGPGVGGHCISVDPWFLVGDYPGLANIILTAREINDSMPEFVLRRIHEIMQLHEINDITKVGLYGLTYKEDVDDTRESPTLQLLEIMKNHLASPLKCYDPFVKESIVPNQYFNLDEFLTDIEIVVIMVAHKEIQLNVEKLNDKVIFDTKNIVKKYGVYKL